MPAIPPTRLFLLGAFLFALLAILLATRTRKQHRLLQSDLHSGPLKTHSIPEQPPYILRSTRVVTKDGTVRPADIAIAENGTIASVHTWQQGYPPPSTLEAGDDLHSPNTLPVVDVSPLLVMPGLIDPHVHVNAPGRTHWEGFETAMRAAAAGGTTTILDMPLNNIPSTVTLSALAQKAAALAEAMQKATDQKQAQIDVAFIGGIVPGNRQQIEKLFQAGVLAFKSFMVDSQSEDFPYVSMSDLSDTMFALAELAAKYNTSTRSKNAPFPPYILHAELADENYDPSIAYSGEPTSYMDYLASRPDKWEIQAVENVLNLSASTGCRVHIAHISSQEAARKIANSRTVTPQVAALVSSETCPHYLLWSAENIPDGHTEFKCAPPIRSHHNRIALWSYLKDRTGVDIVASDHSPADPSLKRTNGNFKTSWGGISGLQYRLQATWTAMRDLDSNTTYELIWELLSAGPARLFGLDNLKGSVSPGLDADFVIWDPDSTLVIRQEDCEHKHPFSPYTSLNLTGVVHWTLVRGRVAYERSPSDEMSIRSRDRNAVGRVLVSSDVVGSGMRSIVSRDPQLYADELARAVARL